jgi:cbb3-type cytochrome oxidase subunit 1
MSPAVRGFLRSAVAWLLVGLLLGLWMAVAPGRMAAFRAAHLHALLPGFVLMMIFGVGYHVLPRFAGRPMPWARGPMVHLALANAGLALLVPGFVLRMWWPVASRILIPLGGVLVLLGAVLFAHVIWKLTEAPRWNAPSRGTGVQPPSMPVSR